MTWLLRARVNHGRGSKEAFRAAACPPPLPPHPSRYSRYESDEEPYNDQHCGFVGECGVREEQRRRLGMKQRGWKRR